MTEPRIHRRGAARRRRNQTSASRLRAARGQGPGIRGRRCEARCAHGLAALTLEFLCGLASVCAIGFHRSTRRFSDIAMQRKAAQRVKESDVLRSPAVGPADRSEIDLVTHLPRRRGVAEKGFAEGGMKARNWAVRLLCRAALAPMDSAASAAPTSGLPRAATSSILCAAFFCVSAPLRFKILARFHPPRRLSPRLRVSAVNARPDHA
jgi:hypothetical protein